jgi:RNA polymerase sigma-70 factor (ECF subfamily)
MTGQRPVAEDLVQEAFMSMLKYKSTFKDDSEFVPWMFGIGRNACLAHLKRAARERLPEHSIEPAQEPSQLDDPDDDRHELMRRALLRLPVDRREVLLLSRYEFKSYEEIARVLQCSVGAVKVRAHRAMKQLREIYLSLAREGSP